MPSAVRLAAVLVHRPGLNPVRWGSRPERWRQLRPPPPGHRTQFVTPRVRVYGHSASKHSQPGFSHPSGKVQSAAIEHHCPHPTGQGGHSASRHPHPGFSHPSGNVQSAAIGHQSPQVCGHSGHSASRQPQPGFSHPSGSVQSAAIGHHCPQVCGHLDSGGHTAPGHLHPGFSHPSGTVQPAAIGHQSPQVCGQTPASSDNASERSCSSAGSAWSSAPHAIRATDRETATSESTFLIATMLIAPQHSVNPRFQVGWPRWLAE